MRVISSRSQRASPKLDNPNRFNLRTIKPSDADWIFEACQDEEIQRWTQIPKPYLKSDAEDFTRTLAGDVAVWVITADELERPAGVIGIHSINQVTRVADIGYWTTPWARGIGAMSNALRALIELTQENPNISCFEATIATTNIASRRTVESVGFKLIGDAPDGCDCGDGKLPAVLYAMELGMKGRIRL